MRAGVEEIAAFFEAHPEVPGQLGHDAIQCFLDTSRGAEEPLESRCRDLARQWFDAAASTAADDYGELLPFAVSAHELFGNAPRTRRLQEAVNDGVGPLDDMLGYAWRDGDDYELLQWLVCLLDAQATPGLRLPPDVAPFGHAVWRRLLVHPFVHAADCDAGAMDDAFYDAAYLATHIGYVPTGYGRHRLRASDHPRLFHYLRANFDAVLGMGELDLVAEFVDLFRQAGTDVHLVERGTKHLLALHERAGAWMAHVEAWDDDDPSPYDLVHKAWTGVAGVRNRQTSPRGPYRDAFERWCLTEAPPGGVVSICTSGPAEV